MSDNRSQFLTTLVYGQLSVLELASLQQSSQIDFKLLAHSDLTALMECDVKAATSLIGRLGGSYKIVKLCGTSVENVFESLPLPDDPKFAWTISSYGAPSELLEDTRESVRSFLKVKSLGKSRYILPDFFQKGAASDNSSHVRELKLKDLRDKVVRPASSRTGFDIVVAANLIQDKYLFGYTVDTSDHAGFEKRDFSRSYQNPTTTIGPRLARVLVNLAMKRKHGSLLDPFCGLGTILQEALVLGYDVCGVDISASKLERCKTNLNWLRSNSGISPKLRQVMIRGDASRLRKENLPKIEGVATEPILLPIFVNNPSSQEGSNAIGKTMRIYRETFESLHSLLEVGTRVAFVAPAIIDAAGREHRIHFDQIVNSSDYRLFKPESANLEAGYPFRVPSSRKKTIQRDVYVMEAT